MAWWLEHTFLPTAIVIVVMLLVLWPTRESGTRLLWNWGVPEPTGPQVAVAIGFGASVDGGVRLLGPSDFSDVLGVVEVVVLVVAGLCWMWLAVPTRRSLARAR
ncbi:MAG TPA: hypothetical protein VHH15_10725 [Actinophytocola sp.]|nr:hypothetical protein [Actinophytocola sp.]